MPSLSHRSLRRTHSRAVAVLALSMTLVPLGAAAQSASDPFPVDLAMIAEIREEGLQRSQLPNTLSYMTDVLGARLTNSDDMQRAQAWVIEEMKRIGLTNTAREAFMDYGVRWDNEYVSLHMLEPDYSPLVGYPIAHTPGTDGKQRLRAIIADVRTRQDLARYRGTLRGMAVMSTPPAVIDLTRFATGRPRRTDEEMRALADDVLVPARGPDLARRRDILFEQLNSAAGLRCELPEGAMYIFCACAGAIGKRTPDGRTIETDTDFTMYLLDQVGVAVVQGAAYGLSPYFRASFVAPEADLVRSGELIRQACAALV